MTLVEHMIGKGLDLKIYDPEVRVSQLIGANRDYIDNAIPHIGDLISESLEETIRDKSIVILGLQGDDILEGVYDMSHPDQYTLDLVGGIDRERLQGEVQGICW